MVLVILVTVLDESVFRPPLVPELPSVTVGSVEITPSRDLVGVGVSAGVEVTEGLGVARGVSFGVVVGVMIEPSSSLAGMPKRFSSRLTILRLESE